MKKTLLIDTVLSPYAITRFNAIKDKIDGEFHVWFQSFTDINRKWTSFPKMNFEHDFLRNVPLRLKWKDIFTFNINYEYPKKIKKLNPDHIIILWWDSFTSLYSVIWAKKNRKRLTLWSGSTKFEKSWKRIITLPYVKWLIKSCDDYISYWTRATEYLISLWAEKSKIQEFYNTVDVEYFTDKSDKYKKNKEIIKWELWISTKYVLMFNGQLIERKWIWEMIDGYDRFQKEKVDISLIIVGSGQEEEKLKKYIENNEIKNVHFTWFVQFDELPKFYAISDIFTLPSREEVWWLVINEAMSFWLPIITSFRVWASVDLVKELKNWYIMKENTINEFYNWLKFIFNNNLINKNKSIEIIKQFSIKKILENINFNF
ncbi:MAG: glycosyl transferase group 1 [uncultured bacterium (gcode 4)]|uniref:Glycosyl transferase group 1 n=1 Tax=uncultured bacterium (gcode 4) TaxID=1234023 RepID=K2FTH9_9BACT|nr:MAG: glycosyl transferase group 1 [uncultured bacterium (gcode 4)]